MRYFIEKVDKLTMFDNFDRRSYYELDYNFMYRCDNCGTFPCGKFSYANLKPEDRPRKGTPAYEKWVYNNGISNLARKSEEYASKAYKHAVAIDTCPICGAKLKKEKGFYFPDEKIFRLEAYGKTSDLKAIDRYEEKHFGFKLYDVYTLGKKFTKLFSFIDNIDRKQAKNASVELISSVTQASLPEVLKNTTEIKANSEKLKEFILHLIHLENNIYSLEQRLPELYYQRLVNDRAVVLSTYEPAFKFKAELQEARLAYKSALESVHFTESYEPQFYVKKPTEPKAPILATPGLFNKKKVLAENEALTANYQAKLEAYQKQLKKCEEEEARLVETEKAKMLCAAQEKAASLKVALENAERVYEEKFKAVKGLPTHPTIVAKELLDKEIADVEALLQKTYAARNALYACDIIFAKYRNVVALSTFYEYLLSGRCSSLEGADGAYNIYEGEIRADRIIGQLDTVISSLEQIKQNQYMLYGELTQINSSLNTMNKTMNKALESIRNMEENTKVIAYNTAVSAHYSKVTAQLTDALGYMVAFS